MKQTISILFSKLPEPGNWKFWILIAFFLKSGFFTYKVFLEENQTTRHFSSEAFGKKGGDTDSYFEPIENYLNRGTYDCKVYEDYRMPGYGFVYYLLRLILPITYTLDAITLLQLSLDCISVYYLALIALALFKERSYFYLTFAFYGLSTYVTVIDGELLTESFCTSILILILYILIKPDKAVNYFIAGFLLTWCIFMKPVMAPLLGIFALYILVKNYVGKKSILFAIRSVAIFFITFLVIDSAWMYRNYHKYERVIPLTKSIYYPNFERSYMVHLFSFLNSFGGSIVWWDPKGDIRFFMPTTGHLKTKINVTPPSYIYTSAFNFDSLVIIKNLIADIENKNMDIVIRQKEQDYAIDRLDTYAKSIKREKPFLFYISSRFFVLRTYFAQSGTYNLFIKPSFELSKIQFIVKIFYSLFYYFIVLSGLIGCFYLLVNGIRSIDYFLIGSTGLYMALIFPLALKLDEARYFITAYPIFVLGAVFLVIRLVYRIQAYRIS